MSDLSQLRRRLVRIERTGKRLKRELEELKALRLEVNEALTRTEERRILRLEEDIAQARKDWAKVHHLLEVEEHRLLDNPAGFLRFT